MTKRYAFVVDSERCFGCMSCAMACKNYYQQSVGVHWRDVHPLDESIYSYRERAFFSLACNHCDNPVCAQVCPVQAYEVREDGIVVHLHDRCIGCKNCVNVCPYSAPKFNEETKKAEKCSMCHERVDAGQRPACVEACPVEALQFVDLNSYADTRAVQYPPGYPEHPEIGPSTRFIMPGALPEEI